MHPTRFLQGDAYEVYNRVFVPLAEQARIIDRTDKSLLSIKLRTIYEFEPRRIQVNCLTINQDYNSEVPKVWLQAKNAFSPDSPLVNPSGNWNCFPIKTDQALATAVLTFSQRLKSLKVELTYPITIEDLNGLRIEIENIKVCLESALKTVVLIGRTYDLEFRKQQQGYLETNFIPQLIKELDFFLIETDLPESLQGVTENLDFGSVSNHIQFSQALQSPQTMVNIFSEKLKSLQDTLSSGIALEDLEELRKEICSIKADLTNTLETKFYRYPGSAPKATENLGFGSASNQIFNHDGYNPCSEAQNGFKEEDLHPQYKAILRLIQGFDALFIQTDLTPSNIESD